MGYCLLDNPPFAIFASDLNEVLHRQLTKNLTSKMNCKNCNAEVNSNFCPNCGQPTSVKRIDRYYIIREIGHLLHFERGLLYTIRALITNPGESIRTYLLETRSRLVKPVFFIIVTSLVYSLCNHYFHFARFPKDFDLLHQFSG